MAEWGSRELLLLSLLVLAAGGTDHAYRPSRRVCAASTPGGEGSESFMQRIYQPFLTTCDGHRACSTYRTIYRTAYRRRPGPAPARPRYTCCPGWKRTGGLPGACGAVCQPPCQNGGRCVQPGRCHCPAGWQGNTCQTDVDECRFGRGGCPQHCVNTAGSYQCQCQEGHRLSADRALCVPMRGPPTAAPCPKPGRDWAVHQEVQSLQSKVAMLEQVNPSLVALALCPSPRGWVGLNSGPGATTRPNTRPGGWLTTEKVLWSGGPPGQTPSLAPACPILAHCPYLGCPPASPRGGL
ncbi:epidermal growth factor-like protein 7 isoform X2 [Echinops telfairi]|uniref:Epidermal growth factor-like protein 7 isoform X2 n=1 Tax=Echinops telfairi TaxID=9371 RepID=A0AC55D075_ECHTE|nr:epidermal growth factor-like protein 7 isoform X2 [Echinops telfairi]